MARTFLKLPNWHVRCLSRDPASTASQALTALGAEVVQGDLADPSSLSKAFYNANAIFLNTDFWEIYRGKGGNQRSAPLVTSATAFEKEVLYGKNAAHAAAAVPTLERFVYSTLPLVKKHSKGKYAIDHLDSKGTISDYIMEEEPELAKKTSFIYLGGYNTNPLVSPNLDPTSGTYMFILPFSKDIRMPVIDPKESTGPFVRALIEDEDAGTSLLAYDSYPTIGEIVDLWSRASGQQAIYMEVTSDFMHQKFGLPRDMLHGLEAQKEYGYTGGVEGIIEPFQLKKQVKTKSLEDWLNERDWKAVLESMNPAKK